MDDSHINAIWVTDNETNIRYLIDLRTNKVLMIGTPEENNEPEQRS